MSKIAYSGEAVRKPIRFSIFHMHVTTVSARQRPSVIDAFYYGFQMQHLYSTDWKTSMRSPTIEIGPWLCTVFRETECI